jgi:hypothetical protein
MLNRRNLLQGLLAAPAIVRVTSLMPVKVPPLVMSPPLLNFGAVIPATAALGDLFYQTSSDNMFVWDGSIWALIAPTHHIDAVLDRVPK